MSVNFKMEGEKLILQPEGRIDTNTSPAVEAEIDSLRAANPHSEAVLDLENVEYLSSAGLRVVLRLRKNEPTLEVINVASEVYEVFDMTGFTEMMPISKAYRRISVDGCEVIGQGANGKVYRISEDIIVKVYMNPDSLPDIHRERELARKAFVLGIPTAISYDVVKVGEGYAIADAATRAGERGTFRISGEFLFETHPDYKIEDNSYAALDLETGRIVPRGTPNSFGDIDVNLVSPPTPKEPGFAICHFSQPYHP